MLTTLRQAPIRGDEGHLVLASVLDAEDARGLWIELNTERHRDNPAIEKYRLLIPWRYVIALVVPEGEFSAEMLAQTRTVGFTQNPDDQ